LQWLSAVFKSESGSSDRASDSCESMLECCNEVVGRKEGWG